MGFDWMRDLEGRRGNKVRVAKQWAHDATFVSAGPVHMFQLLWWMAGADTGGGGGVLGVTGPPSLGILNRHFITRNEWRTIQLPNRHFERSLIQETINVDIA